MLVCWPTLLIDGLLFRVILPVITALMTFYLIQNRIRKKDLLLKEKNDLISLINQKINANQTSSMPALSAPTRYKIQKSTQPDLENRVGKFLATDYDNSVNLETGNSLLDEIRKI